jgi:UDP-N-acetylmuramate: L-alanyl-gamma-D-glutamyl-meso-diaminopimelate ligase
LPGKWVLAVSGTHGKTSTSSMLAWILEYAGMSPGYLIGGVPSNFSVSARLGETPFFVIEADEYDSAFFDKRSKFVHYQPRTLVINNLEFDHGDIFDDLAAIQKQFHHLVRTVPHGGLIIRPQVSLAVDQVMDQGCWTPTDTFHTTASPLGWSAEPVADDGSHFKVLHDNTPQAEVSWTQLGQHNVANALAAIAAAHHVGVTAEVSAAALHEFAGVKRRLECLGDFKGVHVYDDFAHHPTAIATTLEGLRAKVGNEQILAVIEPRSNTMRLGFYQAQLAQSCAAADHVLWYKPEGLDWDLNEVIRTSSVPAEACESILALIESSLALMEAPCHIVIMSNGGFGGIHQLLIEALNSL